MAGMNEKIPLFKLPAGRKRWNRGERLRWLKAYRESGLRPEVFSRQQGLPEDRIGKWLKKESGAVPPVRFKELALPVVETKEPEVVAEIYSTSGIRTRIFAGCDRELVTQIFHAVYPCGR